jgi:hypothetical protein
MTNKKDQSHSGHKNDRNNNHAGKNQEPVSGARSDKEAKSASSGSGSSSKSRSSRY